MNFPFRMGGAVLARWFGPQREARRLDRDAATIIEAAQSLPSSSKTRETALRISDELKVAHARGGDDPSRYTRLVEHFRNQHREARRRRDDTALTALTLVIIYLRAEMVGADADPARHRIDAFVSEWTRV